MKIYVSAFLLLVYSAGLSFSFASQDLVNPFLTNLSKADRILLGKVIAYSAVSGKLLENSITGPRANDFAICGWKLEVEVDHAFRGADTTATIFTDEFDGFIGVGERYFILVYENKGYRKVGNERFTHCAAREYGIVGNEIDYNGQVDLSEFEYTTRNPRYNRGSNIFPIDPYLSEKYGGDWLISLPNNGSLGIIASQIVEFDENPAHPEIYFGVNLFELLKEYWLVITAPKVE